MNPTIVSFSGGRSSAFMLIKLLEKGYKIDKICFQNTGKEKEETLIFVKQIEEYIKREIIWIEYRNNENGFEIVTFETASRKGEPFRELIKKRKFLPNVFARFCTQELKIRPLKKYLQSIGWKNWNVALGIRYDESLRWGKIIQNNHKDVWVNELPMMEWGTTINDIEVFWALMPFTLQLKKHEGNCDLCFLKGTKKIIQILREEPETAQWWNELEIEYNATFKSRISIANLLIKSKQPLLFDEYDIDYPCFCNAD